MGKDHTNGVTEGVMFTIGNVSLVAIYMPDTGAADVNQTGICLQSIPQDQSQLARAKPPPDTHPWA